MSKMHLEAPQTIQILAEKSWFTVTALTRQFLEDKAVTDAELGHCLSHHWDYQGPTFGITSSKYNDTLKQQWCTYKETEKSPKTGFVGSLITSNPESLFQIQISISSPLTQLLALLPVALDKNPSCFILHNSPWPFQKHSLWSPVSSELNTFLLSMWPPPSGLHF